MIVTMNQIAYFKPETTARRLKTYYYSVDFRPEVFLSYLRLITITTMLCPQVAKLSLALYRKEVRELFFTHRHNPRILKQVWRFRRFFTPAECCELLRGTVVTPVSEATNEHGEEGQTTCDVELPRLFSQTALRKKILENRAFLGRRKTGNTDLLLDSRSRAPLHILLGVAF